MSSKLTGWLARGWRRLPATLWLILAARLALGAVYSLSVPIWEADNEDGHFAYARYIARHGHLLTPGDPEAEQIFQKFQPPLYYILTAGVLAFFDLGDTFQAPERNPFLSSGVAGANYALHPPDLTAAQSAQQRAVLAARLWGVLLSTLSVIPVVLGLRRLWPTRSGSVWLAACLYAFWPQFLFTGSMVTNDVLVTALGALTFYLAVRLSEAGFQLKWALALGAALGAAVLSKINALGLAPAAGLAVLFSLTSTAAWRHPLARRNFVLALLVLGAVLAAAVAGLSQMPFVTGQVFQLQTVRVFLEQIAGWGSAGVNGPARAAPQFILRTSLASYGWGNLETEAWIYDLGLTGAALGLIGLGVWAMRRPAWAEARAVVLAAVMVGGLGGLAVALSIAAQNTYVPGRYLLPALPGAVVLLVTGWRALWPARWHRAGWQAAAAGVVIVGWVIPFQTLAPVYARPSIIDPAAAGNVDRSVAADFGDAIRLWGFVPSAPVQPGGTASVTLCWEARAPIPAHYSFQLEVVGPDGQGYGRLNTYPGHGNYPTGYWKAGEAFCDLYEVPVWESFPAPAVGTVRVVIEQERFGPRLPVRGLNGEALGSAARVPISVRAAHPPPAPAVSLEYRFGEQLKLLGYTATPLPGNTGVRISLLWEAGAAPRDNYTVFVHLRDTPSTAFAQNDETPRGGAYPTSVWAAGERVSDEHVLTWPAGITPPPLTLYLGVYRSADGIRLPVVDGQGRVVPNGEVILPWP